MKIHENLRKSVHGGGTTRSSKKLRFKKKNLQKEIRFFFGGFSGDMKEISIATLPTLIAHP